MPEDRPQPTVGESLTWPPDVILHPDHSAREAAARLDEKGRPFAPVVDGDAVVGVLTLGRMAGIPADRQDEVAVRDCMLSTVPFLYAGDPASLGDAIGRQTEIQHFCVVDHEHRLLGIFTAAGTARTKPVNIEMVRKRLAVTPGRASASEQGELRTYAEAPTLFVDARRVREPLDSPDPATRRRRDEAMRSKL